MKRLQPVIWSKGTLLTPQHLQVQDRYIEELLTFQLDALHFERWGFKELRVDQSALAKGVFALSAASGIFADGLLFEIPDSDLAPPAKPIRDYFGPDQKSISVYLAVPHFLDRGLNVSGAHQNAASRYISELTTVRDDNNGSSFKSIQVGRKNFRLLVESEHQQGSSILPVARINRTPAETFELDPHFVPPLVDILASDYLMTIARRLLEILTAKSSNLSGMRRHRNQSLVDFGASDIANFWLLYTLNTHFPILRHLFETRRGHPEKLFSAMLSLASALTTFSSKTQPRDMPLYDHNQLGLCFTDLDEKLRFLLETVVPSNCVSLPLKPIRASIYATAIDNDKYLVNTRMFLAVRADMSEDDLIRKAANLIKVSSADRIEQLVEQALPGLKMTHLNSPPSSIPIKLNHQYFSLGLSGKPWDAISSGRNLAAYVPEDFPNPELELLILLPQAV